MLDMTPEERALVLQKAQETKLEKKRFAEENLKVEYEDENHWRSLASELGIRLPQKYEVGPRGVRRVARKLNIDLKLFLEEAGFNTLKDLCSANPKWTSLALAGLLLEWYIDNR